MSNQKHVLIIGGGISGLMAAHVLDAKGFPVTIIDKGRGIGGRLATRRINFEGKEGVFDYGAQYFTVRSKEFKTWTDEWLRIKKSEPWSKEFFSVQGTSSIDKDMKFKGHTSLRDIAKHMASNFYFETGTRAVRIDWQENKWRVTTALRRSLIADILLLTPPVPQILTLLDDSGIVIAKDIRDELNQIVYNPCIAMLALLDGKSAIPAPGGIRMAGEPISWMADNTQKGISPHGQAITIHGGPAFSESNYNKDEKWLAQQILSHSQRWLKAHVLTYQIHRWKYSQPTHIYGEPFLYLENPGPLYMAGDSFTGGRIESAAISGLKAAEEIVAQFPL